MVDWSEITGCVVVVDTRATSDFGFKCNGEVGGDDEGDLLSEWYLDFDLGAIHSSVPPSSAKYVDDPDLSRNAIKHRDNHNHKHIYAVEITIYFINVEY